MDKDIRLFPEGLLRHIDNMRTAPNFAKQKTDLFRVVPPDTFISFELKFHALPEKDNVPVRANERCSAIRFEKK